MSFSVGGTCEIVVVSCISSLICNWFWYKIFISRDNNISDIRIRLEFYLLTTEQCTYFLLQILVAFENKH